MRIFFLGEKKLTTTPIDFMMSFMKVMPSKFSSGKRRVLRPLGFVTVRMPWWWFTMKAPQYEVPGYVLETLLKGQVAKKAVDMEPEERAAIRSSDTSEESKALNHLMEGWKPNIDPAK